MPATPAYDQIRLDQHALIEASAGTGKTYALEQLMLRILTEERVTLDKILCVTYTEKAAAEMKMRLRSAIENAIQQKAEPQPLLSAALDQFDQAQIFTIHGFCMRVLKQYPFEHGQGAGAAMARDDELMEVCLREIQRTVWPQTHASALPRILEISGFENGYGGGQNWEARTTAVAARFRHACGHQLRPVQNGSCGKSLAAVEAQIRGKLVEFPLLIGGPVAIPIAHPFYSLCARLPMNKNSLNPKLEKVILPVLGWLADPASMLQPITAFKAMLERANTSTVFKKEGFGCLLSGLKENRLPPECECLRALVEGLDSLCAAMQGLEFALSIDTVRALLEKMNDYKRERGLQSFEDLLCRVDEALAEENPRSEALLGELRRRFRFGIVDEFQDTDPVQWRIFRRIFIDGQSTANRLIVVGDPKQSIYGFRNADVATYSQAEEEIRAITGRPPHELGVNWRSCTGLLTALNHFFERSGFFSPYRPVKPPEKVEDQPALKVDRTGRKPLTLVRLTSTPMALARVNFSKFVAAEIKRLLPDSGRAIQLVMKKKERALRADDIAVLILKRAEARPIEAALREWGIPYSFYKKAGIWQSDEALHLLLILKALARPDDVDAFKKMLLSRIIGFRPDVISRVSEGSGLPLEPLLRRWRHLLERRRWTELFASILEETGSLLSEASEADGDRRVANFRYIAHALACEAYRSGLDILDIVQFLRQKRTASGEDESGLQPIETEEPKVKLMTIHASKGLEFPIVFMAGGFTKGKSKSYLKYHDGAHFVFDLQTKNNPHEEKAEAEEADESRRLFYVAMTRAVFKLYLPVATHTKSVGPVGTILHPIIESADLENLAPREVASVLFSGAPLEPLEPEVDSVIAPNVAETARVPELPATLSKPDLNFLFMRRVEVQSYSRLVTHASSRRVETIELAERVARGDDDSRQEGPMDDLPPGAAAGEALHAIFENIYFDTAGAAESPVKLLQHGGAYRLIAAMLKRHIPPPSRDEFLRRRELRTAELVWNALHTPLPQLNLAPLWKVTHAQRRHEVEFHMPFSLKHEQEGIRHSDDGYLMGIMDLVFEHEGRYFLADWKSNTLAQGYAPSELQRDILERRYDLQYRIYLQALKRWLPRIKPSFSAARDFGGVFYFYVRGMRPGSSDGIFFRAPTKSDWSEEALLRDVRANRRNRGRLS